MKRRDFLCVSGGAIAGAWTAAAFGQTGQSPTKRPNILWLTTEDISPHLGCYGYEHADTPNLDALAEEGVRFTNAYSVSGVCAPSRSCLITGMYPTTMGTNHMRCSRTPEPPVTCFTKHLRDAGYYCTNNRKTDYNFPVPDDAWDENSGQAHWRNRPDASTPFFAVFNFTGTHESATGQLPDTPPRYAHDPDELELPPYYPDTPLMRKHWAHYYDTITKMDQWAGELLRQLEEDGLAENTVVFFYGDHGVGFPRAKRWVYDSGLHVTLIVRWPGKLPQGEVRNDLVSFVDFGATALSLAEVEPPDYMQGRAFLGDYKADSRSHVFAARDRMDERYDIIRAVRNKRYKYIRNYEPNKPYDQHLEYPEGWPMMQEMRRLERAGELEGPEKLFFRDTKPLEELYDTENDPHEIRNIADSAEHQAVLDELRATLDQWMLETHDLGLVPEMQLDAWIASDGDPAGDATPPEYAPLQLEPDAPTPYGKPLNRWIEALNASDPYVRLQGIRALGVADAQTEPVLVQALGDPVPAVAFWAARGLGELGIQTEAALDGLREALEHAEVSVHLAAAEALCKLEQPAQALPVVLEAARHSDWTVRLYAVQVLEQHAPREPDVREALEHATGDDDKYVARVAEHALDIWPE